MALNSLGELSLRTLAIQEAREHHLRRSSSPATLARLLRKHVPWKESATPTCKTATPARPPRRCDRHYRSTSASATPATSASRKPCASTDSSQLHASPSMTGKIVAGPATATQPKAARVTPPVAQDAGPPAAPGSCRTSSARSFSGILATVTTTARPIWRVSSVGSTPTSSGVTLVIWPQGLLSRRDHWRFPARSTPLHWTGIRWRTRKDSCCLR